MLEELRGAGKLGRGVDPAALARFVLANLQGALLLGKASRDPQVVATCFDLLKNQLSRWLDGEDEGGQ